MSIKELNIKKIKLSVDDVLLVRLPSETTNQQMSNFREGMKKFFPHNKVLVYNGDIEWGIVQNRDVMDQVLSGEIDYERKET